MLVENVTTGRNQMLLSCEVSQAKKGLGAAGLSFNEALHFIRLSFVCKIFICKVISAFRSMLF